MAKADLTDKKLEQLVAEIVGTYQGDLGINFIDATNLPVRDKILEVLDMIFEVLFPGFTGRGGPWFGNRGGSGAIDCLISLVRKKNWVP